MTWRASAHDYTRAGVYHITIRVAEELGQALGKVVGSLAVADGLPDAPHTALTPIGQMVEHELLHAIHAYYPMIVVDTYIIMPEHLHFILVVQDRIVSQHGKVQSLGQVISGFKLGCNRCYWKLLKRAKPAPTLTSHTPTLTKPASTLTDTEHTLAKPAPTLTDTEHTLAKPAPTLAKPASTLTSPTSAGNSLPVSVDTASGGDNPLPSLFDPGYCDVMPVDDAQLATQRAYIAANPRSRLLRTSNRSRLMPQRGGIDTAVTLTALRGYLQRECPPHMVSQEAFCQLELRLLLADGKIYCDSYGNRTLLTRHCLPVVCHRKDAKRFGEQKRRCLEEAERGAVLVSARIAKGEQEIMDEAQRRGYPVVLIADNGFPEIYHPSAERIEQCAMGKLLIVTPWLYQYRKKDETVSVPFCKTMNCVAQALCRTKDNWW